MAVRYHFKDIGQDLLWFDVEGGKITGAGPFHNRLYAGMLHYDHYSTTPVKVGGFFRYSKSPQHEVLTIKYPIVRIEKLKQGSKAPRPKTKRGRSPTGGTIAG